MSVNSGSHLEDDTKSLNRVPHLAKPLLRFDLRRELQELRREDSWRRETGRASKTLAKYPDFRVILVLMKADTHMNEHRAEARISIQALLGKIFLHVPNQKPFELSAGQLLTLDCGMDHDVEALEESALLPTVPWRKGAAKRDDVVSATTGLSQKMSLDPTLEQFASEHNLPARWLELRKACNRLVVRSDFWYRRDLLDEARKLAVEASDIQQTTLRQRDQSTRMKESATISRLPEDNAPTDH